MVGVPEGLIIFSEIVLASYPILIKAVPTNLWTQIVSRMMVYGGLAFTILLTDMKQLTSVAPTSLAGGGLLNLLHIATSYKAFADLPAGNAMSIFYAYPVWNLLGAWLLLGEEVPMESMPWVGLAIIGMVLVAQPDISKFSSLTVDKPFATLCAVLSGVTESAIYFFFKIMKKQEGTFKGMFELYGGSFMWMLPVILGSSLGGVSSLPKIDFSWKVWLPMILFNAFVGFTGYAMRFAAIPMVSTLIFSALNFVGIVAAFIFGYLFQGEKPSFTAALGAFAIIVANGVLLSRT
jgi:drug/metabolite transporter (DMT)-like permease